MEPPLLKSAYAAGFQSIPIRATFGVHYESIALIDRLHFRPNLEVGLGDDLTHVGLNMEFVYKFPRRRQSWNLYAGGGPAVNFFIG